MSENELWFRLWKYIIIGITIILLGTSGCTMHRHYRIANAIEKGFDPIRTGIAMNGNSTINERIVALMTK